LKKERRDCEGFEHVIKFLTFKEGTMESSEVPEPTETTLSQLDQNIQTQATLHDMGFNSIEVEGALSSTGDQLVPSLDLLVGPIPNTDEIRANEWETLNERCHSLFGYDPTSIPKQTKEQKKLITNVAVFAWCQDDSYSGLAKVWLGDGVVPTNGQEQGLII
jgi:hypothetical protein